MTDDDRSEEGAEEAIEDLEAPASALRAVAGGATPCPEKGGVSAICVGGSCHTPSHVMCLPGTSTGKSVVYEM